MPTTQDIEAGLAPQGIGSPEPTPQLRLTPPPEVPYQPPTQVVDRQAYLTFQQRQAQQQAAQAQQAAEAQRIAQALRAQQRYEAIHRPITTNPEDFINLPGMPSSMERQRDIPGAAEASARAIMAGNAGRLATPPPPEPTPQFLGDTLAARLNPVRETAARFTTPQMIEAATQDIAGNIVRGQDVEAIRQRELAEYFALKQKQDSTYAGGGLTPEERARFWELGQKYHITGGGFQQGLGNVVGGLATAAGVVPNLIGKIPAGGLPGMGALGTTTGPTGKTVEESDPFTQAIYQSAPYIALPALGPVGEAANAAMLGLQGAAGAGTSGYGLATGQLSPGQAALSFATTVGPVLAPYLLKFGFKGIGATVQFLRSAEGQTLMQDIAQRAQKAGQSPEQWLAAQSNEDIQALLQRHAKGGVAPIGGGAPETPPPEPTQPETTSRGLPQIANDLRTAVATARRLGPEQAAMISEQKAARVAGASARLQQGGEGFTPFHESKSFLAGEYEKPTFEPINLPTEDVNAMVGHISTSGADYFTRLGALTALEKFTMGVKPAENELAKLEQFFPEAGFKKALEDQIMLARREPLPVNPEAEALKQLPTRGATQGHLLESDPQVIADRAAALKAAQESDVARQREIARLRQKGDELGARMLEEAGAAPVRGQQIALTDAVNEAYIGALGDKGVTMEPHARFTRLLEHALTPLQLVKSIKTAFDIGWAGRQGWRLLPTNPREWWSMFGKQFLAFKSEKYFNELDAATKEFPNFDRSQSLAAKGGRNLAYLERGTGSGETSPEEFLTPAGVNPVADLGRKVLNPSERAFVGPGNWMRQAVLDSNVRRAVKVLGRPLNDAEFQVLVDNINNATLRGNTRWLKAVPHAQDLASLLFSVKGAVSGPQFVMDAIRAIPPSESVSPIVRRIVAERVAAYIAMGMSTLGAMAAGGFALNKAGVPVYVKVDLNHNSKTFGQVDVGGFKWNYWGSDQPLVRAAIALATGRQQMAAGLPPQEVSRWRTGQNLIASKLAPGLPTWLFDQLAYGGFDPSTQQNTRSLGGFAKFAGLQTVPIVGSSPIQAYRDLGLGAVVPSAVLEATGFSTSTFNRQPTDQQKQEAAKAGVKQQLESAHMPVEGDVYKDPSFRDALGKAFNTQATEGSFEDFKAARIQEAVDHGIPKGKAEAQFNAVPIIKELNNRFDMATMNFWRANPDLLRQAIESGATQWSQEKEDIIKAANQK